MFLVTQSAAGRMPNAGHLTARNGNRVLFVADPEQAPGEPGVCHARPDDRSPFGIPWRQLVLSYNASPRNNPLGLLPAHALYPDAIYAELAKEPGVGRTFILSAGWGLVRASFLLPNYDITLSPEAEPFRRREPDDVYADFCMLPTDSDEDLYLFASAEYLPLFCRLTAAWPGQRIVYHPSGQPPEAPGCELRAFNASAGTDWHQACVRAFLAERSEPKRDDSESASQVSSIESRLKETVKRLRGEKASGMSTAAARAAIREAGPEIEEYLWLTQTMRKVDVSADEEFQQRFSAFHGISHRSEEWHATYFRLLELAKVIGAEFADILDELWQETGRYEPTYASRLVATVDPDKPFWDHFALMHAGLRPPGYLDPDKLQKAADTYRHVHQWYAARLESPAGKRMVGLFDQQAPEHADLSALKKLEFMLRPVRRESEIFTAAG